MRRRAFLVAVAGGMTGCAGPLVGSPDTTTVTPAPVPTRDCRPDGPATDAALVRTGLRRTTDLPRERYADLPCPTLPAVDRTVCAHSSAGETEPVLLVATDHLGDRVSWIGDRVTFALRNRSGRVVTLDQLQWRVYRTPEATTDSPPGAWTPLESGPAGCRLRLRDGEAVRWHLEIGSSLATAATEESTLGRLDLPPGTYAMSLAGRQRDGSRVGYLAPFTVRRIVGATGIGGTTGNGGGNESANGSRAGSTPAASPRDDRGGTGNRETGDRGTGVDPETATQKP